jgi:hypothetical protein
LFEEPRRSGGGRGCYAFLGEFLHWFHQISTSGWMRQCLVLDKQAASLFPWTGAGADCHCWPRVWPGVFSCPEPRTKSPSSTKMLSGRRAGTAPGTSQHGATSFRRAAESSAEPVDSTTTLRALTSRRLLFPPDLHSIGLELVTPAGPECGLECPPVRTKSPFWTRTLSERGASTAPANSQLGST